MISAGIRTHSIQLTSDKISGLVGELEAIAASDKKPGFSEDENKKAAAFLKKNRIALLPGSITAKNLPDLVKRFQEILKEMPKPSRTCWNVPNENPHLLVIGHQCCTAPSSAMLKIREQREDISVELTRSAKPSKKRIAACKTECLQEEKRADDVRRRRRMRDYRPHDDMGQPPMPKKRAPNGIDGGDPMPPLPGKRCSEE